MRINHYRYYYVSYLYCCIYHNYCYKFCYYLYYGILSYSYSPVAGCHKRSSRSPAAVLSPPQLLPILLLLHLLLLYCNY